METSVKNPSAHNDRHHKRTTSSVLKSIVAPRSQKHDSSTTDFQRPTTRDSSRALPLLPPGHPDFQRPLTESSQNLGRPRSPTKKSIEIYDDPDKQQKPKKSKSSTNLSAFLSRPKSSKTSKKGDLQKPKDKENQSPPSSAPNAPTPIWAQFAHQGGQEIERPLRTPLKDQRSVDDEVALYTPKDYSPSKQRAFLDHEPTLGRRPKSAYFAPSPSMASSTKTVSELRRTSSGRGDLTVPGFGQNVRPVRETSGIKRKNSVDAKPPSRGSSVETKKATGAIPSDTRLPTIKNGSRVMAAVAAWNGKGKESVTEVKEVRLDSKAIESAFEALLDSRNVPQATKDKMRSLDTNIKADFIKQDKQGSASSTEGLASQAASYKDPSRPSTGRRSKTDDCFAHNHDSRETTENSKSTKKSRPRSLTFTLSKGDSSPTKKQKSEGGISHGRGKSIDLGNSSSSSSPLSKSLTSASAAQALAFIKQTPRPAVPEDFITYLKKVQNPESVDIGKLHKLRQLLRNETVSWVDSFITKGGMSEIVELLHRIIGVEWREEHEDALFHETLLCLKALCTTSLALSHLSVIESSLFPKLLAQLFSEDKKGPSEFSTRGIVISLLFTYLSASPVPSRAHAILSYLHDPSLPEAAQPPNFITSIYVPRPYRVWCKEVVNVTKEVFWIFIHNLNIVPYPSLSLRSNSTSYQSTHFPPSRPPVPAAPYVGGVEWDATNYLAAHLDLLNGLLASLPTREERNALRQELKDSGFEKIMGGSLRTCKDKFYGSVHAGLGTWVGAAGEDGWGVGEVREGPRREERGRQSPKKKKDIVAPRLEMPVLDVGGGDVGGWL